VREIKNPVGDEGHNKGDYGQKCFRRQAFEKSVSNAFNNNADCIKTTRVIVQ
jgi:hypothetical protein